MPQLDRYLAFSETFWFMVLFTLSYISIYYVLTYLIKGMRLREGYAIELLTTCSAIRRENNNFQSMLLPFAELKLLNEKGLKNALQAIRPIQKVGVSLLYKSDELQVDRFSKFESRYPATMNVNEPLLDFPRYFMAFQITEALADVTETINDPARSLILLSSNAAESEEFKV